MISVKEENMVATTSHNHWRSVVDSNNDMHDSNKLAPGAKVMLFGLLQSTLTYKDQCWQDLSGLNGSIGYILRREANHWIVELDSDKAVCLI